MPELSPYRAPRPLAVYPFPLPPEQEQIAKRAVEELAPPFPIIPVAAHPGEPGHVLAMGTVPPFICECAIVRDPTNAESVKRAVAAVLDPSGEGLFGPLEYLNALMPGTKEVLAA